MKRPAFLFYPGDWRRDTALCSCSLEARGLWLELLCVMHDGEPYGSLAVAKVPLTETQVAGLVGIPVARYRKLLAELERAGVPSRAEDGTLYSRRMVKDERVRNARAAGGQLGGNPALKGIGKAEGEVGAKDNLRPNQEPKQKPTPAVAVAVANATTTKTITSGKPTWLTLFAEAWVAAYGGQPAFGRLGKALKPVVAELGESECLARWHCYLAATPAGFAAPEKFASIHGTYAAAPAGPGFVMATDENGENRPHRKRPDGGWEAQFGAEWRPVEYQIEAHA